MVKILVKMSADVEAEGRKWGLEIEAQKDFMTVSIEVY